MEFSRPEYWCGSLSLLGDFPNPGIELKSMVAQTVKNPPAMRETWVLSLGWEDALEKGMATHSSILENSMDCIAHGVQRVDLPE